MADQGKVAQLKQAQMEASLQAKAIQAAALEGSIRAKVYRGNRAKSEEALKALHASFPHTAIAHQTAKSLLSDAPPSVTPPPSAGDSGGDSGAGVPSAPSCVSAEVIHQEEEIRGLTKRLKQLQADRQKIDTSEVPQVRGRY